MEAVYSSTLVLIAPILFEEYSVLIVLPIAMG